MPGHLAELTVFPAAFGLSFGLTILLRRYASGRMLDIPNQRSSHDEPTPRGGGLAIVLAFLATLLQLAWSGLVPLPNALGLAGAGAMVAVVGFLDDRSEVSARWRLLVHFASAAWALAWLGGVPPLPYPANTVGQGWLGWILMLLYLVWVLNLYNFMDGIDGLAGVEAITVCLGAAILYHVSIPGRAWAEPILLLFAVLGFLVWNFPRAKIFLGDAGSGFLGITLGALSVAAAWKAPAFLWSWIILLGVFIVDSTVTLIRRVARGERPYQAHRSHAYQYAARRFGSHKPVTLAVGAINVLWLLPLALLVGIGELDGIRAIFIAYAPLIWLAYRFKAGAPEQRLA